jgi:hypothetical protein
MGVLAAPPAPGSPAEPAAPPAPGPGPGPAWAAPAAPPVPGTSWTVNAPAGLRLRQGPYLTSPVILALRHGEKVYDLGDTQYAQGITWAYVRVYRWGYYYDGYCAAAYLSGHSNPSGPYVSGLKVTASALRLRAGPGLGYAIRRIVPYGTVVQDAGGRQWANGFSWTQVSIDGVTLWAASNYLTGV